MHPRAVEFRDRVRSSFGFEPDVHELDEGTKTARDAADAVGTELAQIAKSVVLVADGELVLALASGEHSVSERKLARELGVSLDDVRTATAAEGREALGWSIGGVPPFGHDEPVRTLCDERLTDFDTVWGGAGTPKTIFPIPPAELIRYAEADVADVFE